MSGAVRRRPDWRDIKPTLKSLVKIPSVLRTLLSGGDDAVLKMAIELIETNGARVIGVQDIVPELLAEIGTLGARAPGAEDQVDIEAAEAAAIALGHLDVGQGAVALAPRRGAGGPRGDRCNAGAGSAPESRWTHLQAAAAACWSSSASRNRTCAPISPRSVHRPSRCAGGGAGRDRR